MSKDGIEARGFENRVLSRRGARELSASEVNAVAGGSLKTYGTKTGSGHNDTLTVEDDS